MIPEFIPIIPPIQELLNQLLESLKPLNLEKEKKEGIGDRFIPEFYSHLVDKEEIKKFYLRREGCFEKKEEKESPLIRLIVRLVEVEEKIEKKSPLREEPKEAFSKKEAPVREIGEPVREKGELRWETKERPTTKTFQEVFLKAPIEEKEPILRRLEALVRDFPRSHFHRTLETNVLRIEREGRREERLIVEFFEKKEERGEGVLRKEVPLSKRELKKESEKKKKKQERKETIQGNQKQQVFVARSFHPIEKPAHFFPLAGKEPGAPWVASLPLFGSETRFRGKLAEKKKRRELLEEKKEEEESYEGLT